MPGEAIRAHKAIARAGLASLREAEQLIRQGHVRINGQVVRTPGCSVVPGRDALEVNGVALDWGAPRREAWALYKPRACVTTLSDPQGRPTVRDFFPRAKSRLFPIGRLDYDAEGLILLTNDGELAQHIAHPSHGVEKTYLVKIKGLLEPEELRRLAQGQTMEGRHRRPARVRVLHTINDKTWLEVILREGIHHHIKQMFRKIGHRVLKIKRYQIGPVVLGDMQPGDVRRHSDEELAALSGEPAHPHARPRRRTQPPADTPQ
ncbi:MAG: rRNA pseudouridine synthase [Candidatus Lambdaproteobacteria bacterium]|nr:rRNA pseudouridine synthase [Candidatus Lambdaproteobacteria bacterium]